MFKLKLSIFLMLLTPVAAFALEAHIDSVYPNRIDISWDSEEGASFYDVYLDRQPVARLKSSSSSYSIGGNDTPLTSNTEYSVIVSARRADNSTIDSSFLKARTPGWEGRYRWVNTTKKDNGGKCTELTLDIRREDVNGGYSIYLVKDDGVEFRIAPLIDVKDGEWKDFDGDSVDEISYRENSYVFNTTSIVPSKWRVNNHQSYDSRQYSQIETKCIGLSFITETFYFFNVDDSGTSYIDFHTVGNGVASWGIFQCPDKGSDGHFILKKIS